MNFAAVAFYDTFELAGSLRIRASMFKVMEDGRRVLPVRVPKPGTDDNDETIAWAINAQAGKAKWPELQNLLGRMRRDAETRIGGEIELGRVFLEMLDRGAQVGWHTEEGPYFERFARCVLALRTNPAALMVCGVETASPQIGWLTAVNVRVPCCAINMGETPRVHLVVDSRRKAVEAV